MDLLFAGDTPTLHPGRCLNRRHAGAHCTRCVDACPAQAIALDGATPHLDTDACVRCGVCTTICPTDSFVASTDYAKKLCETVANLPQGPIALVCAVHPRPDVTAANFTATNNTVAKDTAAKDIVVVQHRRCLAALSVAHLLELSAGGRRSLWLDDSPCAACPLGAAQQTLAHTVDAARTVLHSSGLPSTLLLHSERPPTADAQPRRVTLHDGAQPTISRRALLARLRPRRPAAQGAPFADNLLLAGAPLSERLPQQTPPSRRRLLTALAALPVRLDAGAKEMTTAGTPFGAVQVEAARCSACALCARFCPTGALHFTQADDRFALAFQPAACIDCAICVVACPEQAVSLGDTVSLAAILMDEIIPLATGNLVKCTGCGILTAPHTDDPAPRCHVCRQGAGAVTPLRDGAGLMADLLARTAKRS